MKTYLYSISRDDLKNAHGCIQACHAAIEYARLFMSREQDHPSFIHLTIRDKAQLEQLRHELNSSGIETSEFHEPYQDWGLTAIACLLTESQRHLLSHLSLWRAA